MKHPLIFWRNFTKARKLVESFAVGANDLVLDVGSGQNPNPRANVLCDRFAFDHTERNENPLVIDRPLVVGDAARLPFRDQAFDFVICSHLLEHVESPETVIAELTRVARRGYIETPSAVWEKFHSYPFHRWYVRKTGATIVFEEKLRAIHDPELQQWMDETVGHSARVTDAFDAEFQNLGLLVEHLWKDKVDVIVKRSGGRDEKSFHMSETAEKADHAQADLSIGGRILKHWGKKLRTQSDQRLKTFEDVIKLCSCPNCRKDLRPESQSLSCTGCGAVYPVARLSNRPIPQLVTAEIPAAKKIS